MPLLLTWTDFTHFSGVSIAKFELVSTGWVYFFYGCYYYVTDNFWMLWIYRIIMGKSCCTTVRQTLPCIMLMMSSFLLQTLVEIVVGIKKINSFQPSIACLVESSYLICNANRMTGFYMKCKTGLKWVNVMSYIRGDSILEEILWRKMWTVLLYIREGMLCFFKDYLNNGLCVSSLWCGGKQHFIFLH